MKRMTEEWFISAESDLLLIRKINSLGDLTHLAAFHAQQSIEKSFKAVIEEFNLGFIKTHSLETLYNLVKDKIAIDPDYDLLIILDQLYIDSRYPGEMGLLPNGKPSVTEVREFFRFARKIFKTAKSACRKPVNNY
jgi:HEPN domain-containing protein